jgi:hypothetical protein
MRRSGHVALAQHKEYEMIHTYAAWGSTKIFTPTQEYEIIHTYAA